MSYRLCQALATLATSVVASANIPRSKCITNVIFMPFDWMKIKNFQKYFIFFLNTFRISFLSFIFLISTKSNCNSLCLRPPRSRSNQFYFSFECWPTWQNGKHFLSSAPSLSLYKFNDSSVLSKFTISFGFVSFRLYVMYAPIFFTANCRREENEQLPSSSSSRNKIHSGEKRVQVIGNR